MNTRKIKKEVLVERTFHGVFYLAAILCIISLLVIGGFILYQGYPAFAKVGVVSFLTGTVWQPLAGIFGIAPMIVASILVTIGSLIIGIPIGLMTAIFIAELAEKRVSSIFMRAVELLAGIPSVVYGFFTLMTIVPLIDKFWGGGGNSMLAAIFVLGIMILPTIITVSANALRAVPESYREGSLALGENKLMTIFRVVVPCAKSGIFAAIVLGIGRSIGETMAVMLVAGNTVQMPHSILDRVRTLTANAAFEMGYASGIHVNALFATAVVLLFFIIVLNVVLTIINRRGRENL